MTKKELSLELNNRAYAFFSSNRYSNLVENAKENNLVIISNRSDDLCYVHGAIYKEIAFYSNTRFYIDVNGIYHGYTMDVFIESEHEHKNFIDIIADSRSANFEYKTDIKNVEWFNIFVSDKPDDFNIYCRGFVFSLDDLK